MYYFCGNTCSTTRLLPLCMVSGILYLHHPDHEAAPGNGYSGGDLVSAETTNHIPIQLRQLQAVSLERNWGPAICSLIDF